MKKIKVYFRTKDGHYKFVKIYQDNLAAMEKNQKKFGYKIVTVK